HFIPFSRSSPRSTLFPYTTLFRSICSPFLTVSPYFLNRFFYFIDTVLNSAAISITDFLIAPCNNRIIIKQQNIHCIWVPVLGWQHLHRMLSGREFHVTNRFQ